MFVDDDAPLDGNGVSWQKAYKYLQDALAVAAPNDQIWVAEGTYKPDRSCDDPNGTGVRTETFKLKNEVAIYGGYAGLGTPEPNARDISKYETILSGNINNPHDNTENSFHVVTASGPNSNAILDGFTITEGNANGTDTIDYGGGMYNAGANPKVRNCKFVSNYAINGGAGMVNAMFPNYVGSKPEVINCIFLRNAVDAGGYAGGAIYNGAFSAPTIVNCVFIGNYAPTGGAIFNTVKSTPKIINCTITINSADKEAGGIVGYNESQTDVNNCIIWNNKPCDAFKDSAGKTKINVKYSDVQYCYPDVICSGEGNICQDPCFVDPNGSDDIYGTGDDDLHLLPNSPCIDAGDSNALPFGIWTDLDGEPRFVDDPCTIDSGVGTPPIVDMGTYEFQDDVFKEGECFPQTYSTYNDWQKLGEPNCWCGMYGNPRWPYQCDGDVDNKSQVADWRVYTDDLTILANSWRKKSGDPNFNPCADFDHKGQVVGYRVYTNDLTILSNNWKKTSTQLPDHCPRPE